MILNGNIFGFVKGIIPEDQYFVRLLFALVTIVVAFAGSGFITGLIGGETFDGVSKRFRGKNNRLMFGTVLAITNAIAILPLILLFVIFAYYNQHHTLLRIMIIFAILGAVYGLIFSFIFIIANLRRVSISHFLGLSIGGFTLGGAIAGAFYWLSTVAAQDSYTILRGAALATGLFCFYTLSASFVAYSVRKFEKKRKEIIRPLYAKVAVGILLIAVIFSVTANLSKISSFLLIRDAGLDSELTMTTKESAWILYEDDQEAASRFNNASVVNNIVATYSATCRDDEIYFSNTSEEEKLDTLGCVEAPLLMATSDGRLHMIWVSEDNNLVNFKNDGQFLYESVFDGSEWSDPYFIGYSDTISNLEARYLDGIFLKWEIEWMGTATGSYAYQPEYRCDPAELSRLNKVIYDAIESSNLYDEDSILPYCQNEYNSIAYLPNPVSEDSKQPETLNGSFDQMASLTTGARYEVLFATMEWVSDEDGLSPGKVYTDAVAELYEKLKRNPGEYPEGITVRILLGNYPEIDTFEWGNQIFNVLDDLHASGVYELENEEIGWRVEIVNFEGTWPHSHSKFLVIDGKELLIAGYNYSYLHLSKSHPSQKGLGMVDMGLHMTGPVAQSGMVAYDQLWDGATQINCPDYAEELPLQWTFTCEYSTAEVSHSERVSRFAVGEGEEDSFALFRNDNFKEADIAIGKAYASAEESIDILHVNFSLQAICDVGIVLKDACDYNNALSWMEALMESIENEDVKVRIMVEKEAMNGMENRIGISAFYDELKERELEDNVEIKFYSGKLHAKSVLIDQELLIIGSMNLHYSSWGKSGLTELSLTTSDEDAILDYSETFEQYWDEGIPAEDLMDL